MDGQYTSSEGVGRDQPKQTRSPLTGTEQPPVGNVPRSSDGTGFLPYRFPAIGKAAGKRLARGLQPKKPPARLPARAVRSQPPVAKQIAARGPPVRWRGLRAVPVALRSRRALRPSYGLDVVVVDGCAAMARRWPLPRCLPSSVVMTRWARHAPLTSISKQPVA